MTTQLLIAYGFLLVMLLKPLLERAKLIPASCTRCAKRFERRELCEPVCACPRS